MVFIILRIACLESSHRSFTRMDKTFFTIWMSVLVHCMFSPPCRITFTESILQAFFPPEIYFLFSFTKNVLIIVRTSIRNRIFKSFCAKNWISQGPTDRLGGAQYNGCIVVIKRCIDFRSEPLFIWTGVFCWFYFKCWKRPMYLCSLSIHFLRQQQKFKMQKRIILCCGRYHYTCLQLFFPSF